MATKVYSNATSHFSTAKSNARSAEYRQLVKSAIQRSRQLPFPFPKHSKPVKEEPKQTIVKKRSRSDSGTSSSGRGKRVKTQGKGLEFYKKLVKTVLEKRLATDKAKPNPVSKPPNPVLPSTAMPSPGFATTNVLATPSLCSGLNIAPYISPYMFGASLGSPVPQVPKPYNAGLASPFSMVMLTPPSLYAKPVAMNSGWQNQLPGTRAQPSHINKKLQDLGKTAKKRRRNFLSNLSQIDSEERKQKKASPPAVSRLKAPIIDTQPRKSIQHTSSMLVSPLMPSVRIPSPSVAHRTAMALPQSPRTSNARIPAAGSSAFSPQPAGKAIPPSSPFPQGTFSQTNAVVNGNAAHGNLQFAPHTPQNTFNPLLLRSPLGSFPSPGLFSGFSPNMNSASASLHGMFSPQINNTASMPRSLSSNSNLNILSQNFSAPL